LFGLLFLSGGGLFSTIRPGVYRAETALRASKIPRLHVLWIRLPWHPQIAVLADPVGIRLLLGLFFDLIR
jgi:hypothetical protein